MYSKNRDKMEIIISILEAANNNGRTGSSRDSSSGASRTRIAYNAFLSHSQLKHYLSVLTDKGMVKHDPSTQTYKTIEKGYRFLITYSEMDEMIMVPQPQF
ncbi:MAG: winged helix-turn-helix domain-containing protein [Thermoproteota archaeon]|nr:winged helix-turn-helix domain-containing protein [Thermoproteota archaeon]